MTALRRPQRLLPLVLLIAFILPLFRFGNSFWNDEATSVYFARWPLDTLLHRLCDPHPVGYYVLLKGWLSLGEQEWWVRWPSLAAGVLAVALVYRLAMRLRLGAKTGVLAALLLALAPLHVWYAAEARMYTLAAALSLAALLAGWQLLQVLGEERTTAGSRWRWGIVYVLLMVLAMGADYTAVFPWIALQMLWLVRRHPRPAAWAGWQILVAAAAYLLWFDAAHRGAVATSFQAFTLAVQLNHLGLAITPQQANTLIRLLMIALAGGGALVAWLWPRWPRLRAQSWVWLLVVLAWLGWALFMMLPRFYSFKRQWVALFPLLALATAYALQRLPRALTPVVLASTLLLTALVLPMPPRESWRPVLADLAAEADNAPVWVDEWVVTPVAYYARQMQQSGLTLQWTPLISRDLPRLPGKQPPAGADLYLILAEGPYRHFLELLPADFFAQYAERERRESGGITVIRYRRRLTPLTNPPPLAPPSQETLWSLESAFPLDVCP